MMRSDFHVTASSKRKTKKQARDQRGTSVKEESSVRTITIIYSLGVPQSLCGLRKDEMKEKRQQQWISKKMNMHSDTMTVYYPQLLYSSFEGQK